jgi:hypothetical protein
MNMLCRLFGHKCKWLLKGETDNTVCLTVTCRICKKELFKMNFDKSSFYTFECYDMKLEFKDETSTKIRDIN